MTDYSDAEIGALELWAPSVEEDYNVPFGTHFHDAVDALKCSK